MFTFKNLVAACVVLLFFSCNYKNPMQLNAQKLIIGRDTLKQILFELHLVKQIASAKFLNQVYNGIDSVNLVDSVIAQHGYKRWQFDTTIAEYTANPKELQKIYEEIMAQYSVETDKLNKLKKDTIKK